MEAFESHFGQWWAVLVFVVLYGAAILFVPFYRKMDRKPATAYMAFVLAFAIEMHGIPVSMYLISGLIGRKLPEGILWGHTLVNYFGHSGMYLSIVCALIAVALIGNGWYNIYHKYWSREPGMGRVVQDGIYRYIRHPQYTGLMLLSLGTILNWATLPTIIMWPFVVWLYYRLARREEQDMVREFGEEYVMYMHKTKRFIPYVV